MVIKSVDGNTKVIIRDKLSLQILIPIGMALLVLLQLFNPVEILKNGFSREFDMFGVAFFTLWVVFMLGLFWKPLSKEVIILDQDFLKIQRKTFITYEEQVYDISKVKNMYVQKRKQKRGFGDRRHFDSEGIEYFIRFEYENTLEEFGRGISSKAGRNLIIQHFSRFALSNDYDIFES